MESGLHTVYIIAVHCMRINGRSEQSLDLTVLVTLKLRGSIITTHIAVIMI